MAKLFRWDIMDTLVRDPFFTHLPGFSDEERSKTRDSFGDHGRGTSTR
ncbi:MAG TPA: hypothetical protein VF331_00560 [Polyangiales bacterium]